MSLFSALLRLRDGYAIELRTTADGTFGVVVTFPDGGAAATFRHTERDAMVAAEAIVRERRALAAGDAR